MKKVLFKSLISFSLVLTACYKDKTAPVDPTACDVTISYNTDVVPIVNSSCVSGLGPGVECHDSWIHQYEKIVLYINNGSWQTSVWGDYSMPQLPEGEKYGIDPLTNDELKTMRCWVQQGYPNN